MKSNLLLKNMTIRFDREILHDVSYEFKSGYFYLLQGQSGIGKSSLLNVLGLLKRPIAGEVVYDGQNLWSLDDATQARVRLKDYGFVFQQHNLIDTMTLEENLKVPLLKSNLPEAKKAARVTAILDKLGLEDQRHMLPEDLSGGEDQRGAIGRALISGARIILADEPTNSLDSENARMFYEQLADFAHQQQAIVIVASHETLPEDYADQILTINNKQLVPQSGTKLFNRAIPESMAGQPTASAVTYRSDLSNRQALVYDNYQSAKKLPIGFLVIVTVMLAVASIVLNVPQILASQQQRELNQATDNSLFVTNNTLGTGSHQDLDPFRNLTIKQIQKIKKMPGITSVQPYYTFLSYGLTKENVRQPVPKGSNFSLGGKSYHVDETFSIQPIYKSDLTKKYLYANGHPAKVGTNFIVSQDFLEKNHISTKSAMGKQVAFEVYIPYAQYLSESELPTNNKKKVAIDGNIYVQQPLAATITGVYASNYPYDLSEQGNAFFMDDASMTTLLHSAIRANTTSDQIFQGFKQQPFGYSALRLEAKSYNDMVSMTKTIKSSSGFYSVSSVAQNVASLNATVQKAKNGTRQIALLFIMASMIALTILFSMNNRQRLREVGILKAVGFTTKDVRRILFWNAMKYGCYCFGGAALLIVVAATIMALRLGVQFIAIILTAFITNLALSFGVTIFASLWPIRLISRKDPIDIIKA